MMIALIDGYHETAEWLLLIAAIVFGVSGVLLAANERAPEPRARRSFADFDLALIPFGLCLATLGWLVL